MAAIAHIFRHPVKSIGVEALGAVRLTSGATMPGDREWAMTHQSSDYDMAAGGWARCTTFYRVANIPALAAVSVARGQDGLRFTHPHRPPLSVDPDQDPQALLDWTAPLIPDGRPRPAGLAKVPGQGMTDSADKTVSIMSMASLRALEGRVKAPLDPRRFRGNIWVDGIAPWEELEWAGREITLGDVRLKVTEPIGRCSTINASPDSGERDLPALATLEESFGHTFFGMEATVLTDGEIRIGDPLSR